MKKVHIGTLIEEARIRNDLSREQLADSINVATTTVLRWEKGTQGPSFEHVLSIAKVLQLPIGYFAGEAEQKIQDNSITFIRQIAALGPTELELLKDTLDSLSKPILKKKIEKDA